MPVYLPGMGLLGGYGYGGGPFAYVPYAPGNPLPIPFAGGYGGSAYGFDPYGSVDFTSPEISAASSISGFEVEVLFSKAMQEDSALFSPTSYSIGPVLGATCTPVSVRGGSPGEFGGWVTVIVTHSGSTLGGDYTLQATGVRDLDGHLIVSNPVEYLALGDEAYVEASISVPDTGRGILLRFFDSRGQPQSLLPEFAHAPGVDSISTYAISSDYPVVPTIDSATQDPTQLSLVLLGVSNQTSVLYSLIVGPATAYDYLGDVLPDDSPEFTGVEVGTGVSSASVLSGLLIGKGLTDVYGWRFLDDTGKLSPTSSFRLDISLDASGSSISPPVLNSSLALFSLSDGSTQVDILLGDSLGTKTLSVFSGAYSEAAQARWDSAPCEISLVRNQQGGFYSLLFNGAPILTFPSSSATGVPTFPAGAQSLLGSGHTVSLFKIRGVKLTSSETLFTSAWNFLHGLSTTFIGSSVLTRDRIITKRGPLVRGWGDPTPAGKQDVAVRVNGLSVEIAGVNPYVGEIYPVTPIPRTSPGVAEVVADYVWFVNPALELAGLNTRGLSLNLWDRAIGHTRGSTANGVGAIKGNRFPMGVALGPYTRPTPKQIAHRYIGFQKNGYSALLNEPTTLALNRSPMAFSIGNVSAAALQQAGVFDGKSVPTSVTTPWVLNGVDAGGLSGQGQYRVVDALAGPYGVGQPAYYSRGFDLALPGVVSLTGRFSLENSGFDGIFSGVGLGVYSGNHLFLVGALEVSGFKHIGILLSGEDPQLESSWIIGPRASSEAVGQNQISLSFSEFPSGVSSGTRIRIPTGTQAGVYTISSCGVERKSYKIVLTISPSLPSDIRFYGNSEFEILFETNWESLCSIRAEVSYLEGRASAYLGGTLSGVIGTISSLPAYPAQTSLVLPPSEKGVAFWGSVSRRATNSSLWDFYRYTYTPERILNTVQGMFVETPMTEVPQNNLEHPWYVSGGYGFAVTGTGPQVILKSTSAPEVGSHPPLEYSYSRVEPYFSNKTSLDLNASFKVDSGRLGVGDVDIILYDGVRKVLLRTLLYVQGTYPTPTGMETGRSIVPDLPCASLSGLQAPGDSGWILSSTTGNPVCVAQGQKLFLEKQSPAEVLWTKSLPDPVYVNYQGMVMEAVAAITSGTATGATGFGLLWGCRVRNAVGASTRLVLVAHSPTEIILLDKNRVQKASFPFSSGDGLTHTYRVLVDPNANNVVLVVDETLLGSTAFAAFAQGAETPEALFGLEGSGTVTAQVYSFSSIPLRVVAKAGSLLGRTFGILLRSGEETSIDGYKIPRFDSNTSPNSSLLANPVQMDWRNTSWVRLYLDPTWGVSFYRPDLPPPPWVSGDFATQSTNPTQAWLSVEYALLPVEKKPRGEVVFGSIEPQAITQSRWDFINYRIRGDVNGFGIAPQNMVLNKAFTMTSGEYLKDTTPEIRTILSRTSTLVRLTDSSMSADRVFFVQVGGEVLPSSGWAFDSKTQVLVLSTPLPKQVYPVTVTFAASRPYTKDYLCSQPLENSPTILNAGTPPVPKSLGAPFSREVLSETPPDSYSHVEFRDSGESLYSGLEFCEKEEGEDVYIAPIDDGLGLSEIQVEGSFTANAFTMTGGPGSPLGGQSPVLAGSAQHFNQTSVLVVSGGSYTSVQGGMVLYPNARANNWTPLSKSSGSMGLNQDFMLNLVTTTPYTEAWEVSLAFGDNNPPSSADPNLSPNPYGSPGTAGHGAAAFLFEDSSTSPFSRLGPWVGLSELSLRSLLGGGSPLSGGELTLIGGSPLPIIWVETSGTIEAAN